MNSGSVNFHLNSGRIEERSRQKLFGTLPSNVTGDAMDIYLDKYLVPVVLGLCFIIGVVGNGALVAGICKDKKYRSIPNSFILSIALCNLAILICCPPLLATSYVLDGQWPFEEIACKLVHAMPQAALAISTFSLVGLSIERYAAFASPPKDRSASRRKATIGILVIWFTGVCCSLPLAIFSALETFENKEMQIYANAPSDVYCREFENYKNSETYPHVHTIVTISFLLLVPLLLIFIFYMSLSCVVCAKKHHDGGASRKGDERSLKVNGTRSSRSGTLTKSTELTKTTNTIRTNDSRRSNTLLKPSSKKSNRRRKTMAKVSIFLILQYIIFWAPKFAYLIYFYFFTMPGSTITFHWTIVQVVGVVSIYINAALVPFTIVVMNRTFRNQLGKYLCCCCICFTSCCCMCLRKDKSEKSDFSPPSSVSSARRRRRCCPCCYKPEDMSELSSDSMITPGRDFPDSSLYAGNPYQEPVPANFYESNTLPLYQFPAYAGSVTGQPQDIYATVNPERTSYAQAIYDHPHSIRSFHTADYRPNAGMLVYGNSMIPRAGSYPNIRAESPKFSRTYRPGRDIKMAQNIREVPAL